MIPNQNRIVPKNFISNEILYIYIQNHKFTCKNLNSSKMPFNYKNKIKKFLDELNKSDIKIISYLNIISLISFILAIIFLIITVFSGFSIILIITTAIFFVIPIIILYSKKIKIKKFEQKWKTIFQDAKKNIRNFFEIFDVTPLRSRLKRKGKRKNRRYKTVYYKNWNETKYKFLSINLAKIQNTGIGNLNGHNRILMNQSMPGFIINQSSNQNYQNPYLNQSINGNINFTQNQPINNNFQNHYPNSNLSNQPINYNFQNDYPNSNLSNQNFQNQQINQNFQNQQINNNFNNHYINNNINGPNEYEDSIRRPLRNFDNENISLSKKIKIKKNTIIPRNTINIKDNNENQNIKEYPVFQINN